MNEEMTPTPAMEEIESPMSAMESIEFTMEKFLDTARVEAVYGEPVEHGDTIIIPCAEVLAAAGFGLGYGSGHSDVSEEEAQTEKAAPSRSGEGGGGGGGGRTFSRPVAVIVASPEGVRVEPVVDITKIVLAALTAAGFMIGMLARMMRRQPPNFNES